MQLHTVMYTSVMHTQLDVQAIVILSYVHKIERKYVIVHLSVHLLLTLSTSPLDLSWYQRIGYRDTL